MSDPSLANVERAELADLFDLVGPNEPTLCEGWNTGDLLAHLIVRESDPIAAPGIVWGPLERLTNRRMDALLASGNFTALVERFRRGPVQARLLPPLEAAMNGMEFFVHHEDVRRAGDTPAEPRSLLLAHEAQLWRRAVLLARTMLRHTPVGVVIENALDDEAPVRLRPGSHTVTLLGKPSELILLLLGRGDAAQVTTIGEAADVEQVLAQL